MASFPKYESLIVIPTGGLTLTLTDADGAGVTITIPAGNYYWTSVAHGASVTFLAALMTALNNGAGVTYTATLDDTSDSSATGKVTITPSSGTFSITWVGTVLRNLLGFTGDIVASAAATGQNQVKKLWLPSSARTPDEPDPTASEDPFGDEETDYQASVSPAGSYAATVLNRRNIRRMRHDNVLGRKTRTALETIVNESAQTWYRDHMGASGAGGGTPFRYYPDRSNDALCHTGFFDTDSGRTFHSAPAVGGWVGARALFSIEFIVRQYVHAS